MNEFHEKYGQGVKSQDVRSDARKVSRLYEQCHEKTSLQKKAGDLKFQI